MPTRDDLFAHVAAERRRLADRLAELDEDQWATPSLCEGWTVREVAAHLVVPFEVSFPAMGRRVLRARGSYPRAMDAATRELAARPTGDLVAALRANAEDRFAPPGLGPIAPLADVVVHGLDVARPLGLPPAFDPDAARAVLDRLHRGLPAFAPRRRVAGLRFEATDLGWAGGTGPVVAGPSDALLLALTGRPAGLDGLQGPGAEALAVRLS